MEFSVDLISDLRITADKPLDWSGKCTSPFCIIAGGVSDEVGCVISTLKHLGDHYRGIFYIDGGLEHPYPINATDTQNRLVDEIRTIPNVVYLHNHIVVLNGIAFIASNSWFMNSQTPLSLPEIDYIEYLRIHDSAYLNSSIAKVQLLGDVRNIALITGSIPSSRWSNTLDSSTALEPVHSLDSDTENKVKWWFYGGTDLINDTEWRGCRYINNSYINSPYWPKRIVLTPDSQS